MCLCHVCATGIIVLCGLWMHIHSMNTLKFLPVWHLHKSTTHAITLTAKTTTTTKTCCIMEALTSYTGPTNRATSVTMSLLGERSDYIFNRNPSVQFICLRSAVHLSSSNSDADQSSKKCVLISILGNHMQKVDYSTGNCSKKLTWQVCVYGGGGGGGGVKMSYNCCSASQEKKNNQFVFSPAIPDAAPAKKG